MGTGIKAGRRVSAGAKNILSTAGGIMTEGVFEFVDEADRTMFMLRWG